MIIGYKPYRRSQCYKHATQNQGADPRRSDIRRLLTQKCDAVDVANAEANKNALSLTMWSLL